MMIFCSSTLVVVLQMAKNASTIRPRCSRTEISQGNTPMTTALTSSPAEARSSGDAAGAAGAETSAGRGDCGSANRKITVLRCLPRQTPAVRAKCAKPASSVACESESGGGQKRRKNQLGTLAGQGGPGAGMLRCLLNRNLARLSRCSCSHGIWRRHTRLSSGYSPPRPLARPKAGGIMPC